MTTQLKMLADQTPEGFLIEGAKALVDSAEKLFFYATLAREIQGDKQSKFLAVNAMFQEMFMVTHNAGVIKKTLYRYGLDAEPKNDKELIHTENRINALRKEIETYPNALMKTSPLPEPPRQKHHPVASEGE